MGYLRPLGNGSSFVEFSKFNDIVDFRTSPNASIDVLIISLGLPGLDRVQGIRTLCDLFDDAPVIIISGETRRQSGLNAIQAGARAYILFSTPGEIVLRTVRRVLAGEILILIEPDLPPNALQFVDQDFDPQFDIDGTSIDTLTDRQSEVLQLLATGKSNAEIARVLGISVHTARLHVSAILRTLNLDSRTQAALAGQQFRSKFRKNTH